VVVTPPTDRQQLKKRVYDAAFEFERANGCCPQCVLAAMQDVMGVGDDGLFKASHTLTGGGGVTTKGTCGALAGAMLAVGSVHGRERQAFAAGPRESSFLLGKRVLDRFVEEFGSPICAEVQTKLMGRSFDLWDKDDFDAFLAAGGHEDKCPRVVATAASIAADVLLDESAEG
jgi:C_GCAxxG_C_C family probable redox protein